jgi:AraC family transcriptional regulator, transcriptional activator of pobA
MSKIKLPVLQLNKFSHKEDPDFGFYIKTFQEHKVEHPFVMDAHSHNFYLLMLFTKGSGSHTIDFTKYNVRPGSVFFMAPAEVHSWNLSDDTDGFVIFFNSEFYMMDVISKKLHSLPFFKSKNKLRNGILNESSLKEIELIMRSITAENNKPSAFKKNILRSYLDVLLYKLSSLLSESNIPETQKNSVIPELEILIEKNFKKHQPVSFYSEKLNITPQQLNTYAKNNLNKTVGEMIHERLLSEAKRLLIYSTLSISEIAYELNFADNSYFNRFFKKAEKLTPDQFRKRFLNTIHS